MQQEAYRRVQEMQNKAKNVTQNKHEQQSEENPPHEETKSNIPLQSYNDDLNNKENKGIFDMIMADKERYLILILFLILASESADTDILLALIYLLI